MISTPQDYTNSINHSLWSIQHKTKRVARMNLNASDGHLALPIGINGTFLMRHSNRRQGENPRFYSFVVAEGGKVHKKIGIKAGY